MEFSPFKRQLYVAGSPMLAALSVGGATSYPIVLLHQLRSNDTTIPLDFDSASWIGSIHGIAGIPSILIPNIMQWKGRKFAFITVCLITIIGWIIAYTAQSATAILISESFHGFGCNSILAVSYLSISEMISPEYRHQFKNLYAVFQTFTMTINGILAQYLHWRTISLVMCVPMVIAVMMACLWPESPYWLAIKGEYSKCEEAFMWLRGSDESSKRELNELIEAQKENLKRSNNKGSLKKFVQTLRNRDFYLPCFHMIVLQYLFYWSGNFVILIYSIELIQNLTQNSSASFYGALVMNMILCLGVITSLYLLKLFKKKNILLTCTFLAAVSMLVASTINGLQMSGFISKSSLSCLFALIAFMIANGTGMVPIAYVIAIEIMPVKHRGIGGAFIVICSCIFHTTSLKISPYLFLCINYWGTFLLYSINCILCGLFILKYIPDTSGRTLQEIEFYYAYGDFVKTPKYSDALDIEPLSVDKEMITFNFEHGTNDDD